MTTAFRICPSCSQMRALADMRGTHCRFKPCGSPRLASPPAPLPVTRHPAIKPESDALSEQLRRMKEAR